MKITRTEPKIDTLCIDGKPHRFKELSLASGMSLDHDIVVNFYCQKCLAIATLTH